MSEPKTGHYNKFSSAMVHACLLNLVRLKKGYLLINPFLSQVQAVTNNVYPDEMTCHYGLHCLLKMDGII